MENTGKTDQRNPPYSWEMLQTEEQRRIISRELAGKRWIVKVFRINDNYGLLTSPEFNGKIYLPNRIIRILKPTPKGGDYLDVVIEVSLDRSKNRYGFSARDASYQSTSEFLQQNEAKMEDLEKPPLRKHNLVRPAISTKTKRNTVHPEREAASRASVFLGKLLKSFVNASEVQEKAKGISTIVKNYGDFALDLSSLRDWIPNPECMDILVKLNGMQGIIRNPNLKAVDRENLLVTVGSLFGELAKVANNSSAVQVLRNLWGMASQSATMKTTPAAVKKIKDPASKAIRKAEAARKLKEKLRSFEGKTGSVLRAADWKRKENSFTIAIDEQFPGHFDETRHLEGVIAGIVWAGEPDEKALPFVRDHRRPMQKTEAIHAILRNERALPFIMPVVFPSHIEELGNIYQILVEAAVKLLLGWILPDGKCAAVRIHLDRYGDFAHNVKRTEYFQGLLQGPRYRRWTIAEVRWVAPERDQNTYIGYADALAYLLLSHNEASSLMAEAIDYRDWPGYVPLSFELIPLLERLESLGTTGLTSDVLDCVVATGNAPLGRKVLEGLRPVFAGRPDLQASLLEDLDRRYQHKDIRDLGVLDRLVKATMQLVPDLPAGTRLRPRLHRHAILFQRANHFGDPLGFGELADTYTRLCDEALANGHIDLVVHCDLHLAVRDSDLFLPESALARTDELLALQERMSLHCQGKVLSSKGQYLAMLSRREESEECFREAVTCLKKADLDEGIRRGELEQTMTYRAINAIEGGAVHARALVEETFRQRDIASLEDAIRLFAAETEPLRYQYHHHLLLRLLNGSGDYGGERQLYLNLWKRTWKGHHHPWELIAMHQGLLLKTMGEEESRIRPWFDNGVAICLHKGHGMTLRVIGAMIATVAWCCLGDEGYFSLAGQLLDGDPEDENPFLKQAIEKELPSASHIAERLRAVLDAPGEGGTEKAFDALYFNYH